MLTENVFLPGSYQENTLMLLVQNPSVIFAYWELSNGQWQALGGHGDLYLRLYEIKGPGCLPGDYGEVWTEIDLPPFTNDWYFHGLLPDRIYCSELGYYGLDHVFYPVLRSNRVETPRAGLSASRPAEAGLVTVDMTPATEKALAAIQGQLPGSMDFYHDQD